jgi:hypothetical protein
VAKPAEENLAGGILGEETLEAVPMADTPSEGVGEEPQTRAPAPNSRL